MRTSLGRGAIDGKGHSLYIVRAFGLPLQTAQKRGVLVLSTGALLDSLWNLLGAQWNNFI